MQNTEVTITALPVLDFNNPNVLPCQQTYAQCDQIATIHVEATDWDVDVCVEHALTVLREVCSPETFSVLRQSLD